MLKSRKILLKLGDFTLPHVGQSLAIPTLLQPRSQPSRWHLFPRLTTWTWLKSMDRCCRQRLREVFKTSIACDQEPKWHGEAQRETQFFSFYLAPLVCSFVSPGSQHQGPHSHLPTQGQWAQDEDCPQVALWALGMAYGTKHKTSEVHLWDAPQKPWEATGSPGIVEEKRWGVGGGAQEGKDMRWGGGMTQWYFITMVNVAPSVIVNCSGLKKCGLHLGLVELNDTVIQKSIVIIFVD